MVKINAKNEMTRAFFISLHGILLSLCLILGFFEQQWLLVPSAPGIKLGLSNIVLLFSLCLLSPGSAFLLMLIKVFLSSLLFSGFSSFFYGLSGGFFSVAIMCAALFWWKLNLINVSICGAVSHILGQLFCSKLLLGTWAAFVQFPVLMAAALFSGLITGWIAQKLCFRFSSVIPGGSKKLAQLFS